MSVYKRWSRYSIKVLPQHQYAPLIKYKARVYGVSGRDCEELYESQITHSEYQAKAECSAFLSQYKSKVNSDGWC